MAEVLIVSESLYRDSSSIKDDDGKWQYSSYLGLGELPQAMAVLEMATAYIAEQEATVEFE